MKDGAGHGAEHFDLLSQESQHVQVKLRVDSIAESTKHRCQKQNNIDQRTCVCMRAWASTNIDALQICAYDV